MPAYEVMHSLIRQGVSCAVSMNVIGDVCITAIKSGKQYETEEACLKGEIEKGPDSGA